MAKSVLVLGKSGTGKTYSIRTLDPKETLIICPDKKDLPFKGWKKMYDEHRFIKTRSYEEAIKLLGQSDASSKIKVVVIDTVYYMIMEEYMNKALIKNFDKYVEMGLNFWKLMNFISDMKSDTLVIMMSHTDTEDFNRVFSVPGGKLVKEKIKPEGLNTVVLETEVQYADGVPSFQFLTQHRGDGLAKAPAGMFPDALIPNDLNYVKECMEAYENGHKVPDFIAQP